ncbi:hypothetical protein NE237_023451 [Protea cynaroides]|uniref:Uncharacterized protein n=1 Tax=Protea cynaroides TaxID=273540 RepID=A0A9Q0K5E7_9MAGN|nr:hypothetical protein NE237_023451 [Protea cynaroides]
MPMSITKVANPFTSDPKFRTIRRRNSPEANRKSPQENGLEPYGTDSRGGCLEGETLRAFIAHFNKLVLEIKDLKPDVVVEALKSFIMDKKLIYSITKMPPRNLIDMLHMCERNAAANDVVDMATEREKGAKASNKTRSDQPDKSIKTGVKNKKPKSEKETIGKIG